ncbi:solute carrier family 25 member 35-like [Sceloporus undulatus]|uniref:solute carrier family 25 member 35-like n=1 Tax=Sceloporus undulatus TaxID=8520 RepID=UPI001C4AAB67|nr:solute carrier family 25 member 35-like [Sceloporus undulatus]
MKKSASRWTAAPVGGVAIRRAPLAKALPAQTEKDLVGCGRIGQRLGMGLFDKQPPNQLFAHWVKTHIQAQSAAEIAVGHQYQHEGMFHALMMIHKEHGILGLWRGAISSVPRVMVGSATQLATFSSTKEIFIRLEVFPKGSWLVALSAGMVSSFTVALTFSPFDVASTRLYNQPVGPQGQGLIYKGLLDCLAKIIRSEGFLGVYKGVGASYFRIGPHTILSLLFWDQLRQKYNHWAQKR